VEIINRIRVRDVTIGTFSALVFNGFYLVVYPPLGTIGVETFFTF